jgi:hypothetical protein
MAFPGELLAFGTWGTAGPEFLGAWQDPVPRHVVALLSVVVVPTQGPEPAGTPGPCPSALIEGTLVADERWGSHLRDTDGLTRKVLWPYGHVARPDGSRLALLDAVGSLVAYEGDLVRIGRGQSVVGRAR